jgi:hypothetical protein
MFISKLTHLTITVLSINQNPDPMIKLVASVVPILNGRDSEGNVICLGNHTGAKEYFNKASR